MTASDVRVLVPAGMLGAGFTAESVDRGLVLGADAIAIDGGSTDFDGKKSQYRTRSRQRR